MGGLFSCVELTLRLDAIFCDPATVGSTFSALFGEQAVWVGALFDFDFFLLGWAEAWKEGDLPSGVLRDVRRWSTLRLWCIMTKCGAIIRVGLKIRRELKLREAVGRS